MELKWIGAAFILGSCGSLGFSIASERIREEVLLRQLLSVIRQMQWELQYRLTPLPELIRNASVHAGKTILQIMSGLAEELDRQILPDAASCMHSAIQELPGLPDSVINILNELGLSLGRFDLSGQIRGLDAVIDLCSSAMEGLRVNKSERLRCCRILGLCAGAAMVILLI